MKRPATGMTLRKRYDIITYNDAKRASNLNRNYHASGQNS